jgi:hypothetical protein
MRACLERRNTKQRKGRKRRIRRQVLWENRGMEKHRKHIDRGVWNAGIITQDSQDMKCD